MASYSELVYSSMVGSTYGSTPLLLENGQLVQTVAPAIEPLTVADVVGWLKRHPDDATNYATEIGIAISAAREKIQHYSERTMIETTYEKVQDNVGKDGRVDLFMRNVTSIVKIETISSMTAETRVVMPSTDYTLLNKRWAVAVSGWPQHRGAASLIVTFKAGTPVAAPGDAAAQAAARAAIRPVFRMAMLNLIGYWLENPEWQGTDAKYVIQAQRFGALPPNVISLLSQGGGIPWGVK